MAPRRDVAAATILVALTMALMFLVPRGLFLAAAFFSTVCMSVAAVALGDYRSLFAPKVWTVAFGLVTALALYAVFFAGNQFIQQFHPLGVGAASESSIYGLIASPGTPAYLQVGVLLSDSVGYESFFRGVLQGRLRGRAGLASPFLVAALDAALHLLTLNILWSVATFIVDSVWGLTFHYSRDLGSTVLSHFAWDAAIFLILPIR